MTMSSTIKNPKRSRSRFRPSTSHARIRRARGAVGRRTCGKNGGGGVSGKLEALKNLVPSKHGDEVVGADRLFQETADYIMALRAQVVVLQTLIHFYGSPSSSSSSSSSSSPDDYDLENPNIV